MSLRAMAASASLFLAAPVAAASSDGPIDDLMTALEMPALVDIMRREGMAYGRDLAVEMRPNGADEAWDATIAQIYDPDVMEATVRAKMAEALGDADLTAMIELYANSYGAQIVSLELSARDAMVDGDVEDAARDVFRSLDGGDDPRLAQIKAFVAANDLVESNVIGALNASFQFYAGMADGRALDLSETEILSVIWDSEPQTRADTREWVYGFLLMAYGPLDDDTLDKYIAFSASAPGQRLNRALFAGFNQMFDDISYALGRALARDLTMRDL